MLTSMLMGLGLLLLFEGLGPLLAPRAWQQMLRLLEQATPGTSRHQGALGCARAGLAYLQKKNSGALRRCESLQVLQALLNRMSEDSRSIGLNGLSTRYSG